MSDFFYRALSKIWGYIAIGVLFGLYAFCANIEIKDLDLWLHLKTGKVIVEEGYVPQVDILSNSIAGKPWINHEWLFQVIIYSIKQMWGFEGLQSMQVVIVLLTMTIALFLGYNEKRQALIVYLFILILFNYQMRFTIRPDIYSLLFLLLFMQILSTKIHERWSVLVLFVLQVLWTNIHGFFFFGPILVSLALISEFLKRNVPLPYEWNLVGRLTDEEYSRLQKIWIAVVLACFINPCGIAGTIYPLGVLMNMSGENKIFFKYIVELQKPISSWKEFFSPGGDYLQYRLLIIISFLSFVFNRRKIDVGALMFWLLFLGFSLSASRNLVFFSFAAYLVIIVNLQTIRFDDLIPLRFTQEKFKHLTLLFVKLALIVWMINFGSKMLNNGYFNFDTLERKSEFEGVSMRNFPYKAVDFLVRNKIQGNFFNDFNSGAYLIGRTYPNIKPFIDGRTEVYGADFFENKYLKVWGEGDEKMFDRLAQEYQWTGAFLNSNSYPIPEKTIKMFLNKKDWVPVYFDRDAVILLKDIPKNKRWIDQFGIDFKTWQPSEIDLKKLGSKPIVPLPQINRALSLVNFEQYELALKELDVAANIAPQNVEIYRLRGKIYELQKKYYQSFINYRIAASMLPGESHILEKLGLAYENIGDYQNAIEKLKKVILKDKDNAVIYYAIARCYAREMNIEKAREYLRKAVDLAPDNSVELLKIGDIMYQQKVYDRALVIYQKALFGAKERDKTHYKIGLTFLVQREYKKAQWHFQKSVELAPDGKWAKKAKAKLAKLNP